ncbi:MAG: twin-arginine translocation signal domain-containing protein [Eggerthellaceae bacterium]
MDRRSFLKGATVAGAAAAAAGTLGGRMRAAG